MGEWVNKLWYTATMEYHSAIKKTINTKNMDKSQGNYAE